MYSSLKLQKDLSSQNKSTLLVKIIKSRFLEFRTESPYPKNDEYRKCPPKDRPPYYNFTRSEFCKMIYLETKNLFDAHQDELSPTDKMVVLKEYIQLWFDVEGYLDIKDTDFAEQYKGCYFGKYVSTYNSAAPMFAGFNLKNITFGSFFTSDMLFLAVNFTGADFSHARLPYTSFNDCNFTGSDLENTNFNQCRFQKCNFEGVDLSETDLCEVSFENCIMYQTTYRERSVRKSKCFEDNLLSACGEGKLKEAMRLVKTFPDLIHSKNIKGYTPLHIASCGDKKGHIGKGQEEVVKWLISVGADKNTKTNNGETALDLAEKFEHRGIISLLRKNPSYPFFLQHLKLKPKLLTAEKVANALWLSDNDAKITNIAKSEFSLWAEKEALCFNQDDIEKCLASYVMKK